MTEASLRFQRNLVDRFLYSPFVDVLTPAGPAGVILGLLLYLVGNKAAGGLLIGLGVFLWLLPRFLRSLWKDS